MIIIKLLCNQKVRYKILWRYWENICSFSIQHLRFSVWIVTIYAREHRHHNFRSACIIFSRFLLSIKNFLLRFPFASPPFSFKIKFYLNRESICFFPLSIWNLTDKFSHNIDSATGILFSPFQALVLLSASMSSFDWIFTVACRQ